MGFNIGLTKFKGLMGTNKIKSAYLGGTKLWSSVEPFTMVFTTSTLWTVPEGVDKVDVFLVGGGGSGGYGESSGYSMSGGGGGGGGYTTTKKDHPVTQGQQIPIVIGSGGYAGTSKFDNLQALGGNSPNSNLATGGNGGSGGGTGNRGTALGSSPGASDGASSAQYANGEYINTPGIGQGSTTKAFGEPNGTLYSGGGGGGGSYDPDYVEYRQWWNYGGKGGGGNGNWNNTGKPGTPNSGGGGGGGGSEYHSSYSGGVGGSGVVIVRCNG